LIRACVLLATDPVAPVIQKGVPVEGKRLTIQEDYGFDVKGYLHLRGFFQTQEVAQLAAGDTQLLYTHPELNRYLALLMAEGYEIAPDTGERTTYVDTPLEPLLIPVVTAAAQVRERIGVTQLILTC
jgi:hypothetical protein